MYTPHANCLRFIACTAEGSSPGGPGCGSGTSCCNTGLTYSVEDGVLNLTVTQSNGDDVTGMIPLAALGPAGCCNDDVTLSIVDGVLSITISQSDGDDVTATVTLPDGVELPEMPDHVCIDVDACSPVFPIGLSPPADALAALPSPVPQGSTADVRYTHYNVSWTLGSSGWCGTAIRKPCEPQCIVIDDDMPIEPVPSDIASILGSDGSTPITVPDVGPNCVIKVQWRDGWQEYIRGADCLTDVLGCQMNNSNPCAFAGCFTPNETCDGGTFDISNKYGGKAGDFEVAILQGPNGDVVSDETPLASAPAYDSGLTDTTLSQLPESGDILCHRIYRWIQPGPPPATADVTDITSFKLASEMCTQICRPAIGCDLDCDGVMDEVLVMPLDPVVFPKVVTLADESVLLLSSPADLEAFIAANSSQVSMTSCGLFGCRPVGVPCPADIVLNNLPCPSVTVPIEVADDGTAFCNDRSPLTVIGGATDDCVPSKWESQIQYSEDGQTWENAESFSGGEAWAQVGQDARRVTLPEKPFPALAIAPGSYIREQVRCITDPGVMIEDLKQAPTPVVSLSPGAATLANSTPDTAHPCYDPANDRYDVRISYLHTDGSLYSTRVEDFDPAVGAAVSFGNAFADTLGFSIGAGGIVSWDATLTPGTVQVDLWVAHNYVCPETECAESGATIKVGGSASCSLNVEEMLTNDNSFSSPSSAVETLPEHGGNYLLCIYNTATTGAPVVQYGAGTEDPSNNAANLAAGVYPADSNSTYPLVNVPGGEYVVVVKHNGNVSICGCLPVEEWDICMRAAQMNYEGPTNVASFCYDLPVNASMTEIEWQFLTLSVADRFTVSYNGAEIFDSETIPGASPDPDGLGGPIATGATPVSGAIPFTYVSGVDVITVCVSPVAGQPAGTQTIFSLGIGCCESSASCEITHRDPYPAVLTTTDCGLRIDACPAHVDTSNSAYDPVASDFKGPLCYREDITRFESAGCVVPFSESGRDCSFLSVGPKPAVVSVREYCKNGNPNIMQFGLAADRTVTRTGNIVDICYNNAADLAMATTAFTEFDTIYAAEATDGFAMRLFMEDSWQVLCGSDGNNASNANWLWNPGLWTINGNCISVDFDKLNMPTDPCASPMTPADAAAFFENYFVAFNPARADVVRINADFGNGPSAGSEVSPGVYEFPVDWGIVDSPCTNYSAPQNYVMRVNANDRTYQIVRADGTVAWDSAVLPWLNTGGNYVYRNQIGVDYCDERIVLNIRRSSDGQVLQEDGQGGPQIGDPGCQTIDLSFYWGPSNYQWVDGPTFVADWLATPQMVAYVAANPTFQAAWMPVMGNVWFNDFVVGIQDVTC